MTVVPNAESFQVEGGAIGVLFCHGFAGSNISIRPWIDHVAAAQYTVAAPLLPGHGTQWQDLERTNWTEWFSEVESHYQRLLDQCQQVFVFGFSMGGALALRIAEKYPDTVAGLVLLNPSVGSRRLAVRLLSTFPGLTKVIRTRRGIGGDIKKTPGLHTSYDQIPTRAVYQVTQLWKTVCADLGKVTAPILVYRSRIDHVVDDLSVELIRLGLKHAKFEEHVLENSYHTAALDNDAPTIFNGSIDWINQHSNS